MRTALAATACVILLAGCGQSSETAKTETAAAAPTAPPAVPVDPSFTGFTKPKGDDQFGYYLPAAEVKIGNFKLADIHVAGQQGFGDWESGQRTRTYGPVMLQFDDVTSPARKNALGNIVYSVQLKVLPTAYAVTDDRVRFVGNHPKLGDVRLDIALDPATLKKSKAAKGKDGATVAKGSLQVGTTPFKDLSFTWRGGDWG